jgi:23S rRNA pseudouridine1911/1915/1917 synthase
MGHTTSFRVDSVDSLKRLDIFLSEKEGRLSRSQIKRLIAKGDVRVGGRAAKAGMRLRQNDVVTLTLSEPQSPEAKPEPIPLKILFEDPHLIVIDKAAGMVVHPAAGNFSGTLVNALLHHCSDLSGIGGVLRPGIVHRLDKDTSGVIVVAKDDLAHQGLSEQFKAHKAIRRYVGIVFGQIPKTGQIDSTVGRHPVLRKKMSTQSRRGKKARTHWKVLENYNSFTLAEFRLETGRTHQIRVHLSSMGHPILGDPLYGGRKRLGSIEPMPLRQGLQRLRRQALHAAFLGFLHPLSGSPMEFSSPLPEDIEDAIKLLKKYDCGLD